MIRVKRWVLNRTDLEEHDFLWIKGIGARIDCTIRQVPWAMGNVAYTVAGNKEIVITTITDRQENMIQLKYSTDLVLGTVFHVSPGEQIRDNWGVIGVDVNGILLV